MESEQQDGKYMLTQFTLAKKSVVAIPMSIGKKGVRMEAKIGGDGVMETQTVEQEKAVLVKSKQP